MECPSLQKVEIVKPTPSQDTRANDSVLQFIEDVTRCCLSLRILSLCGIVKNYYSTRDLSIVSRSLQYLEMVSGTYPSPLDLLTVDCPELLTLRVKNSKIDNFTLDNILQNSEKLRSLEISECMLITSSRKISSLQSLHTLRARQSNLNFDCLLSIVNNCKKLQTVEYTPNHIQENSLIHELENGNIKQLCIKCELVSHQLSFNLPLIHTLNLALICINDQHFEDLRKYSVNLRKLSLFQCTELFNPQFIFPKLIVLNLTSCTSLAMPYIEVSTSSLVVLLLQFSNSLCVCVCVFPLLSSPFASVHPFKC